MELSEHSSTTSYFLKTHVTLSLETLNGSYMNRYNIILESFQDGKGYFQSIVIASFTEEQAINFLNNSAKELGLKEYKIEEIELLKKEKELSVSKLLEVSGKSFFS